MRVSPNTSALLTLLISSAVPCSEVLLQAVQLVLGHVGHVVLEVPTVVPRSEVGVSESQTGHLRPLLVHASIGGNVSHIFVVSAPSCATLLPCHA